MTAIVVLMAKGHLHSCFMPMSPFTISAQYVSVSSPAIIIKAAMDAGPSTPAQPDFDVKGVRNSGENFVERELRLIEEQFSSGMMNAFGTEKEEEDIMKEIKRISQLQSQVFRRCMDQVRLPGTYEPVWRPRQHFQTPVQRPALGGHPPPPSNQVR